MSPIPRKQEKFRASHRRHSARRSGPIRANETRGFGDIVRMCEIGLFRHQWFSDPEESAGSITAEENY
jgi:hypothetical protein